MLMEVSDQGVTVSRINEDNTRTGHRFCARESKPVAQKLDVLILKEEDVIRDSDGRAVPKGSVGKLASADVVLLQNENSAEVLKCR